MRISDWSSDVCSSDLAPAGVLRDARARGRRAARTDDAHAAQRQRSLRARRLAGLAVGGQAVEAPGHARPPRLARPVHQVRRRDARPVVRVRAAERSEEHTSELQSLMRISYAVFCLKKKINQIPTTASQKQNR